MVFIAHIEDIIIIFYLSHVKISMLPWLLSYQPITKELSVYARGRCYYLSFQNGFQACVCDFVDELPDFHIDLFPEREEEEHPGRFISVTDSDVDKLFEGEENTKTKRKTQEYRAKQTTLEGKPLFKSSGTIEFLPTRLFR